MEKWLEFTHAHAPHAHWIIFFAALLAGMNIPISIDLLMIISASLAAAVVPHLFGRYCDSSQSHQTLLSHFSRVSLLCLDFLLDRTKTRDKTASPSFLF